MAETRRKFDRDFKEGAVRLVRETGRPIAEVARDLGVNEGTLGNWVNADRRRRGDGNGALSEDERAELARLRKENAELAMERDVLKRSVALWSPEPRRGHLPGRGARVSASRSPGWPRRRTEELLCCVGDPVTVGARERCSVARRAARRTARDSTICHNDLDSRTSGRL